MAKKQWKKQQQHGSTPVDIDVPKAEELPAAPAEETKPAEPAYQLNTPYAGC